MSLVLLRSLSKRIRIHMLIALILAVGWMVIPNSARAVDTNGDGLVDQVAVCQGNKICVTRGGSGIVNIYSDPTWNSVSINTVVDTNGVAGDDIVIVATNGFGAFQCICIIHDNILSYVQYNDPGWSSVSINTVKETNNSSGADVVLVVTNALGQFQCICVIHDKIGSFSSYKDAANWASVSINSVTDTNGTGGNDIVLIATNASGAFWCICVIHDNAGTYSTYRDAPNWASVNIRAVSNTDGTAGNEIVLIATNGSGAFWCVCVIHDNGGSIATYRDAANWGTVSINSVVDTDGVVGTDVIVVYAKFGGSPGISMVHDKVGSWQNYPFPGNFTIQSVANTDGVAGAEVCSSLQLGGFIRITDRLSFQENVGSCP